jgi:Zn-dependent metalloprotease
MASPFASIGQTKKGFESKKHKDTTLNKPLIPSTTIYGKSQQTLFSSPTAFGNVRLPIASAFANVSKTNARVDNPVTVTTSKESGLPIFISSPKPSSNLRAEGSFDKASASYAYLEELSPITKWKKPNEQFLSSSSFTDEQGISHVRLKQTYQNIPFYDGEVIVHLNAAGEGVAMNGKYHLLDHPVDVNTMIPTEEAIKKVVADVSTKTKYAPLSPTVQELLEYKGPVVDTVIYEDKSLVRTYLLAYEITIRPNMREEWVYILAAKTGTILQAYKTTCHVDGPKTTSATDLNGVSRTVNSYLTGANYTLVDASKSMYKAAAQTGVIQTLDANFTSTSNFKYQDISSTTNTWSPTAVSAHYIAGMAFDYYKSVHGRNSIDDKGGDIISFINVVDDDGSPLDNAFWNNKFMFYGNGNVAFKPLAGGLDVGGHEMTHGVVQNTAALRYQGESGAINESMADIFGCSIDSTNWTIGESVVKLAYFPTGALRSLSDPHNGGSSINDNGYQPRIVAEKYTGSSDNGGVHINSGIPNWAFYKYATSIGRYRASKVFYRALTVYLTQSSQFIDLRIAVIQSAKDLYGDGSKEMTQAGPAFDAVGITDGTGSTTTTTLPTNPGTEFFLYYDTNPANPNGLYRVNLSTAAVDPLLNKSLYHKPSVTDDGKYAYFIGNDNKMYQIIIDPATTSTFKMIDDQPVWANVAVSKDGKRLAAVTMNQDTSIYVFDFGTSQLARYQLYNPTFTQGIKTGGPIYADALEWDYTGENLVYDAFNSIQGPSGETIEYWDINFMSVWNNATNDFGDGTVSKLFSDLQIGESIGNPTYAKNSPSILAFDYSKGDTLFGIVGLDVEHNNLDAIAVNDNIGWPSYSKNDDVLAYTTYDNSGTNYVVYVNLNADKISSNGLDTLIKSNAKWLVFYSLGGRDTNPTGIDEVNLATTGLQLYPNPTTDIVHFTWPSTGTGEITVDIYNSLGSKLGTQKVNAQMGQIDLSSFVEGVYTLNLRNATSSHPYKVLKQ